MMDRLQLCFKTSTVFNHCFWSDLFSYLQVSMNVNEGLTCRFHQQAIAVNFKEGHYITLGDVNKSIVISPDLTSI